MEGALAAAAVAHPAAPDGLAGGSAEAATAFATLGALGAVHAGEIEALEQRQRTLTQQKKALQREIKNKKERDKRLMGKAVRELTEQQLVQVAALKAAATAWAKAIATSKA